MAPDHPGSSRRRLCLWLGFATFAGISILGSSVRAETPAATYIYQASGKIISPGWKSLVHNRLLGRLWSLAVVAYASDARHISPHTLPELKWGLRWRSNRAVSVVAPSVPKHLPARIAAFPNRWRA